MKPYCQSCFKFGAKLQCGRCHARKYCSQQCQTTDWKENGHSVWCGKSGEIFKDIEIRDSPDKDGVGVFALRDFRRGDVVAHEIPFLTLRQVYRLNEVPEHALCAMEDWLPKGGQPIEKIARYVGGLNPGLFMIFSRVNHDCLGNVTAYDSKLNKKGLLLIRCSRDVAAGEELTYPYFGYNFSPATVEELQRAYRFQCRCSLCSNVELREIAMEWEQLNGLLKNCEGLEPDSIIQYASKMIDISNQLGFLPELFCHTHLRLFRAKLDLGKPQKEYLTDLKKAEEYAKMFLESETVDNKNIQLLTNDPETIRKPDVTIWMEKFLTIGYMTDRPTVIYKDKAEFASSSVCANCYIAGATLKCGNCRRRYCSKECQADDWKKKHHKKWCGRSGQIGKDLELRVSPTGRKSLVTLRDFKKGETVIMDHPLMKGKKHAVVADASISPVVHFISAIFNPEDEDLEQKIKYNIFTWRNGTLALFPVITFIDHSCVGNVFTHSFPDQDLLQIRATTDIPKGSALTTNLTANCDTTAARQKRLAEKYGFQCSCIACTDKATGTQMANAQVAIRTCFGLTSMGRTNDAISQLQALIPALEELKCPLGLFGLLYMAIFHGLLIEQNPQWSEVKVYAQKIVNSLAIWLEDSDEELQLWKRIAADPALYAQENVQLKVQQFKECYI